MRYEELVDIFGALGARRVAEAMQGGDELEFADTIARMNPTADQLQHFATLRGIKHAALNNQAPFVRSNPTSILKGSLGLQVTLEPTPGETVVRQVANWIGEDAETLPVTVELGSVVPELPIFEVSGTDGLDNYAILQFGTRGSLLQVEVDIGRGCQFTVGASMATLQLASALSADAASLLTPQILAGMISCNPIVRTENITRTVYIDDVAASTFFKIPAFAKGLMFVKKDLTNAALAALVGFYTSNFGLCGVYEIPANVQELREIPVPGDAQYFQARVGTFAAGFTGNNVGSRAVFRLAI